MQKLTSQPIKTSTPRGTPRARAATTAAQDAEQRLSTQESILLLGALFALAASLASLLAI